ncbi:MAG: glycosyltransferase family 2 protein [Phycisphaerales bacterium]|nr:glycosyltransferase family 2 protein [Phycisphaerales bacterium]
MGPTLGVIVPMFNSASTVAETIRSVQAQSMEDWRLIVVNDGSTDAGPKVVEDLMRNDRRICMIHQANRGLAGARNSGLEVALRLDVRHISFLDADDAMYPGAYEALIRAASRTGASYGGYELCDQDLRSLGRQSPVSAPVVGLNELLDWNRAATHAHLFTPETIGNERFDESLRVVEDYDMWLRLAIKGERWQGVETIVAPYRLRPTSMSKQFAPMAATYVNVVRSAFRSARSHGLGDLLDLSDARFTRVVGHASLMYATMQAILEVAPGKPMATAILSAAPKPPVFSPADLAQAASTALLFGACTAPDVDGRRERSWLIELRRWWVRCAEEQWCDFADIERATIELAHKIVHPDAIVAELLRDAASAHAAEHGVVVLSLDRQGRRVVRAAAARGWRVLAFDDHSPDQDVALLEPIPRVRVVRNAAAFGAMLREDFAGSPWVSCAFGRGELELSRARQDSGSRSPAAFTWDAVRAAIGARNLGLMRSSLHAQRAKAG